MDRKGNCLQVCYMYLNWGPLDHVSRGPNVTNTCINAFAYVIVNKLLIESHISWMFPLGVYYAMCTCRIS